jgi:putative protease
LIELGADAFVIGEQKFGLRLPGEFNREDVRKAVLLFHVKIQYSFLRHLNDNYEKYH